MAALAAFAVAVLATALPWSRFGAGSEPFGAWNGSPTWSMAAAIAAVAGLAVAVGRRPSRAAPAGWDVVLSLLGAVVATACVLALLRPPPFTSPWLGPWVALVAGVAASTASVAALVTAREREHAHI